MTQVLHVVLPILLFLTSIFLILLVLIQRGRGGGLAGAFGGLGGQSAFGTKAGDLFTRITIGAATFWIILCAASVKLLNTTDTSLLNPGLGTSAPARSSDLDPGAGKSGGAAADTKAGDTKAGDAEKSDAGTSESAEPASDTKAAEPAADAGSGEGAAEGDTPDKSE